jgi:hypothetical protein
MLVLRKRKVNAGSEVLFEKRTKNFFYSAPRKHPQTARLTFPALNLQIQMKTWQSAPPEQTKAPAMDAPPPGQVSFIEIGGADGPSIRTFFGDVFG